MLRLVMLLVSPESLCFLLSATGLSLSIMPSYSQGLQIKKVEFCYNRLKTIDTPCVPVDQPLDHLDRNKFGPKNIYMKATITVLEQDLSSIDETDTLPVIASYVRDGKRYRITKGITQENWDEDGDALTSLAHRLGAFDWRTLFAIGISGAKTIDLEIVDDHGNIAHSGAAAVRFNLVFVN
jgi:hypothetical protein